MERIDIGKELEGMMASNAVLRQTIREELPRHTLSEMAGEFKMNQVRQAIDEFNCNDPVPDDPECR